MKILARKKERKHRLTVLMKKKHSNFAVLALLISSIYYR